MRLKINDIKKNLNEQRAGAIKRFQHQPRRAQWLLRRLSRITDEAIGTLLTALPLPNSAACLALGGYGRQALYPYSDVDLLFLLPGPITESKEKHKLEQLIAALWDMGLVISHSSQTLEQCLSQCTKDIVFQTSLLEARFLGGNKKLWFQLQYFHQKQLDPVQFYKEKIIEMHERHHRYGNTPYALEPNCKESPGGLRDLQLLAWLARVVGVGKNWVQIAHSGLLTQAEKKALQRVSKAFIRLRIELHLLAKRREDTLRFDLQPQIAKIYGFQSTKKHRHASEYLMQRYYWAARLVTQLTTTLLQSFDELIFKTKSKKIDRIDQHFSIIDNRLSLTTAEQIKKYPENLLKAILLLQKKPYLTGFDALTLRCLWHSRKLVDASFREKAKHKKLFLKILKQPNKVTDALDLLNLFNILPRYIPSFRAIVGQMQHDLFHIYTVDQHTLTVIHFLCSFKEITQAQKAHLAVDIMEKFDGVWRLYIAALFHDIAKGKVGNHADLGAQIVATFCYDHGINQKDTAFIVFLVKEHLLFSNYAQKKDFYDPKVLREFTKKVNCIEKLNALYLLTVADIQATNPKIWTSWKASLLDGLYQNAKAYLKNQINTATEIIQKRKLLVFNTVACLLKKNSYAKQLWNELDEDYFTRHSHKLIVWHFNCLQLCQQPPFVDIRIYPTKDHWQIMIHTFDQPELFMTLCQTFESFGTTILDAQIYTNPNEWVIDTFVISPTPALLADKHGQKLICEKLKQALLSLQTKATKHQYKVFKYQDARSRQAQVFPISPSVKLVSLGHQLWELTIVGTDRKGLLYDVAQVFAQYRLNLKSAKIMTLGGRIEDSFVLESVLLFEQNARNQLIHSILNLI